MLRLMNSSHLPQNTTLEIRLSTAETLHSLEQTFARVNLITRSCILNYCSLVDRKLG